MSGLAEFKESFFGSLPFKGRVRVGMGLCSYPLYAAEKSGVEADKEAKSV